MNIYRFYLILCLITTSAGIFLFAITQEWIILRFPFMSSRQTLQTIQRVQEKSVPIFYYKHGAWHSETCIVLTSDAKDQTLFHLVSAWLRVQHDEKIITKKVTLESIMLDERGTTAFISFDRSPFNKQNTILETWYLIESLLRTIREHKVAITHVVFFAHHQPLIDNHIDFDCPWPITGFIG